MRNVNLRSLRMKLPKGSISRIADEMGITARQVSNVLNRNWYPQYHNEVLRLGLDILREMYPDDDLLNEAHELGISGGSVMTRPRKKAVKRQDNPDGGGNLILTIGILVLVLFFLVPQFKTWVLGLWSKVAGVKAEMNEAAQREAYVKKFEKDSLDARLGR